MNPTQVSPNRWTVDYLASLPDDELDCIAHKAVGNHTVGQLIIGRCLLAVGRSGVTDRRGLSGPIHYATSKGIPPAEARDARRIASKLEELPRLREAAETGAIGWSYLREVTRKATAETEAEWLTLCQKYSWAVVRRLVKATHVGESPIDPESEVVEAFPVETELRALVPIEFATLLARVTRELSCRARQRLTFRQLLECLVAEHLAGTPFPGEEVWEGLNESARKDLAAEREAHEREVQRVREREASANPSATEPEEKYARSDSSEPGQAAPWAAVAAAEQPCLSDAGLQLLRPARPHWENALLRFNPESRLVTEAQRAEVLRRDAYRCATPCCPNHVWLHIHHIVFYCLGGVTIPENLVAVCSRCHGNIHRGRLRVRGRAPGALGWTDGGGRGLPDHNPQGWFGWDVGDG